MKAWRAWTLRRATGADTGAVAMLLVLAAATVASGREAATALEPRSALQVHRMLDELELPIRLPDAPLLGESGDRDTLLARIHEPRATVAFYAPWCGPCQKELPQLVASLGDEAQLLVVVSRDESREETRRQLSNIGLAEVAFYVDESGRLFQEGRVTSLPTTFLVNRGGGVLARGAGYSQLAIQKMQRRLHSPAASSKPVDAGAGDSR